MDKYVTLLGTEQVQNAASSMRSSAEQIVTRYNSHDALVKAARGFRDATLVLIAENPGAQVSFLTATAFQLRREALDALLSQLEATSEVVA